MLSTVGIGLLVIGLAAATVGWLWGPHYTFVRYCHWCGRAQQCGERIGLRWEGEVLGTPVSENLGDRLGPHVHVWVAMTAMEGEYWWGRGFSSTGCDDPSPVIGVIHRWGEQTEYEELRESSRALFEEFLADFRSRGDNALPEWCQRFGTRIDPWSEPVMGF